MSDYGDMCRDIRDARREARQKHGEVGNRLQHIEKHLEPPLISSN